jgi:hypothetical protein
MEEIKPSTNELEEVLVREHPDALWLVLAVEYPREQITAGDLLGADEL